ncbi:MAG TPA: helix-turn-helix domain-containing protein [Chloroflexota bacterium]
MPGSSPPGQSSHDPVHPQKRHPHPRSRSRCPRCLQRHRTPAGHGADSRGLSSGALEILIRLSAATDGGISIGDLAKAAGLSSSNVIALVDTLQPDGLAQRVPDRRARSRRPPTEQPGKGPAWSALRWRSRPRCCRAAMGWDGREHAVFTRLTVAAQPDHQVSHRIAR